MLGFTYRPLLDGFEWEDGYTRHSGLFRVNFTDPFRTRTPRRSAHYFTKLARERGVFRDSAPESNVTPSEAPLSQNGGGGGGRCTPTGGAGRMGVEGGRLWWATTAFALVYLVTAFWQ